jgi:hypothetical protein
LQNDLNMKLSPLITRADDFGATPGSNDGVLAAVQGGLVQNVGVMAVGPSLAYRLDELKEMQDEICIGLYSAVTSEWADYRWGPITSKEQVPNLCRADGSFPASSQELNEQATSQEILTEVRAQLQTLRDLGLSPRYLDTHMVFNWLEGVDDALRNLCKEEGLVYAHDPKFQSFKCPINQQTLPTIEDFKSALPSESIPVWVFHPALPDQTGALPPEVAAQRGYEARHLATASSELKRFLSELGYSPAKYDSV